MHRSFVLEQEEWRRVHGLGFLGICWNSKSGCTATSRGTLSGAEQGRHYWCFPSLYERKTQLCPFMGKTLTVYTGADPKPLKSTQIFAWSSEDPESDLQTFAPAGMWRGRKSQLPHGSLLFFSPSQVRSSSTTSTQAGAATSVANVVREQQGCQTEKGGEG